MALLVMPIVEINYLIAPHHRRDKRTPTALCVIDTSDIA